jgi:hypothetical protein
MPFAIDEITINLLVDIPENKSIIDTLFIEDSLAYFLTDFGTG